MEFGEKLQKIRKEHNMTQEQLAEKLYISRTAISKWESNRGYPNLDTLKDIAKIFNITIDDLLSSDKIIDIGSRENKLNSNKIINLCFGFGFLGRDLFRLRLGNFFRYLFGFLYRRFFNSFSLFYRLGKFYRFF